MGSDKWLIKNVSSRKKKKVSCALFSRHTSKRGNKDTENWKDFRAELTCKFLPGRALGRQRALREKNGC